MLASSDWGRRFVDGLKPVLIAIFGVLGAAAVAYAIYLGVLLAHAPDESNRVKSKKRMIRTVAGLFVIVVLTVVMLSPDFLDAIFGDTKDMRNLELSVSEAVIYKKDGSAESVTVQLMVKLAGTQDLGTDQVEIYTLEGEDENREINFTEGSKKKTTGCDALLFNGAVTASTAGSIYIDAHFINAHDEIEYLFQNAQFQFIVIDYAALPNGGDNNGGLIGYAPLLPPTAPPTIPPGETGGNFVDVGDTVWGGQASGYLPVGAYFHKGSGGGTDKNPCTYVATSEEKAMLSRLVAAEAGNLNLQAQTAVAEVVMRRVMSSQWSGNTIYDVISASGQYDTYNPGTGGAASLPTTGQIIHTKAGKSYSMRYGNENSTKAAATALAGTSNFSMGCYFQGSWKNPDWLTIITTVNGEKFGDTTATKKYKLKSFFFAPAF